uniref:C2H2-type domain-containing protein n=1 Tax=Lutzomyia longipalpis TaxID=7200 RepID=A0A1B0CHF3_LUTLO
MLLHCLLLGKLLVTNWTAVGLLTVSVKSLQKVKDKSDEDEEKDKTPIEDEPKSFDCAFCNRTFQKKGRLKNHIEGQHMQTKIYPCPDCGKEFTLSAALYRHREIHHSTQSFACDTCGKAFKTRIYLNKHKNIHSETRKPK